MLKTDNEILQELRRASSGVFWLSESDYPFELIQWDGRAEITPEFIRGITGESTDSPIQMPDFDTFMSAQHHNLANMLRANLSDLKVYKVGRINMPVYIVGRSPGANWLGLSTRVVET